VHLAWSFDAPYERFEIYRHDGFGAQVVKVGETTETSFVHRGARPGDGAEYAITAISADGQHSRPAFAGAAAISLPRGSGQLNRRAGRGNSCANPYTALVRLTDGRVQGDRGIRLQVDGDSVTVDRRKGESLLCGVGARINIGWTTTEFVNPDPITATVKYQMPGEGDYVWVAFRRAEGRPGSSCQNPMVSRLSGGQRAGDERFSGDIRHVRVRIGSQANTTGKYWRWKLPRGWRLCEAEQRDRNGTFQRVRASSARQMGVMTGYYKGTLVTMYVTAARR
jgi:hypothetical protein